VASRKHGFHGVLGGSAGLFKHQGICRTRRAGYARNQRCFVRKTYDILAASIMVVRGKLR
jgi:hypothetical protein